MYTGRLQYQRLFVSTGILSKSYVWKRASTKCIWCSSRMHPHTTYWECKCSSVDTAGYTVAEGNKTQLCLENSWARQGSVQERWSSAHSAQGSHPVHFCPAEKQLSWTHLWRNLRNIPIKCQKKCSIQAYYCVYIYIFLTLPFTCGNKFVRI